MAGTVHDTMVVLLQEHPAWLDAVLRILASLSLPGNVTVADATRRRPNSAEVRGDLLFVVGDTGPWFMIEVQLERDDEKARRWPLMAALVRDERRAMGDLVVITAQRHVAEWALTVGHATGPMGTRFGITPVVILLDGAHAEPFLDPQRPERCFFAAWTMHDRVGEEARRVLDRCWVLVGTIVDPALRAQLAWSIYNVLSDALAAHYRELMMNIQAMPESPGLQALREALETRGEAKWKAQGKAEGKAEALLAVLTARKVPLDDAARVRIQSCTDATQLDRWIARAATATTLDAVFAAE